MTINLNAAVFVGPGQALEVQELQLPSDPGPSEVLVRLAASGVCHSDLHVVNGEWGSPAPMVLGHEGAGIVEAVGEGVDAVSVGDRVILSWTPACGRCDFCVAGRPALCNLANETAYRHVFFDGGTRLSRGDDPVHSFLAVGSFGEYAMVPASGAIPIRADAPLAQAALVGCAVTTGVGAVTNTAHVEAGSTVLVIGCGGVGLNIVQGARLVGASTIIAADTNDDKLSLARSFGATHTVDSKTSDLVTSVQDLTGGRGVEYAFEAIGLAKTIELAYESTARGGTTVVVGQVAEGVKISIDPFVMSDQEKRIIGSNYGSCRPSIDFPKIIDLYMNGRLKLDEMVTSRIPLSGVNDALEEMTKGKGIRTVIEYSDKSQTGD